MRRTIIAFGATLLVSATALLPAPAQAQFIRIADIPGESSDRDHARWIDVLSVSMPDRIGSVRGNASGPGTLRVTRAVDRTSSKIAEAIAKGARLKEVVISVPNTGATRDKQPYLRYTLEDVLISSVAPATDGRDRPTETLSFTYMRIRLEH